MNEKEKMQPKVRFREFTGENAPDWEQRKLGETVENLKSGLSRMLSNEDIGIPVIRANNLVFGRVNFNDDIKYWYLQDPKGADTSNYLVHKGDILINFINSESKMGTASYVDAEPIRPTIYTTNILKLSVNNKYYSKFIFYITYTKRYINYVKSITKPAVNQASFTTVEYKKFSLSIPKYEEQKRIGQFFEKLDKLITLHQRKLEQLEKLKNTLLSKMFPKSGTNIPEIRFSDFTDAWKQRKLGEAGDFNPKCSLPKKFEYVDLESVDDTRLVSHRTEYIDNAPSRAQRLAKSGDIFYQTVRPYQKNNFLFNIADSREYVFSTGYAQIRPYGNSEYLMTLIQGKEFVRKVLNNCTGTSYPAINSKDLEKISIFIPKINEQELIGNLFQKIDKLITLHQRNLDNLKNMKQTLLNKMFV